MNNTTLFASLPSMALTMLQRAVSFAGADKLRPNLMGVNVEITTNAFTVTATDDHRLYHCSGNTCRKSDTFSFILTPAQIKALTPDTFYTISCTVENDNSQTIDISGARFTCSNARYVDYKRCIPKADSYTWHDVPTELIKSAVSAGAILANKITSELALTFTEKLLTIKPVNHYGDLVTAEMSLPVAACKGAETSEIRLNANLLSQILKLAKTGKKEADHVRILTYTPLRPALIQFDNGLNETLLLMPLFFNR